jgi:hypothetical protein
MRENNPFENYLTEYELDTTGTGGLELGDKRGADSI